MANLKMPKTEDELKGMTVANTRKAYSSLASDYSSIVDNKITYCPKCGKWLSSVNFYQNKNNADNLEHWGCKKDIVIGGCDYDKATDTLTDNKEKAKYMCRVLDWIFLEKIYDDQVQSIKDALSEKNRSTGWQQYIVMIQSLGQYRGKTFENSEFLDADEAIINNSKRKPRKEIIKLFGNFPNDDLLYLQDQYDDWCQRTKVDSKSQETYVVQICFILLDIYKARKAGKDTDKLVKQLNDATQAANLQPRQNVLNSAADSLTFSQLILKWEENEPIPEPEEDLCDVSNIGKNIRVWFSGWLANALGLNTPQSREYLEEVEKYSVSKPETYTEEGSSSTYNKIFGSGD